MAESDITPEKNTSWTEVLVKFVPVIGVLLAIIVYRRFSPDSTSLALRAQLAEYQNVESLICPASLSGFWNGTAQTDADSKPISFTMTFNPDGCRGASVYTGIDPANAAAQIIGHVSGGIVKQVPSEAVTIVDQRTDDRNNAHMTVYSGTVDDTGKQITGSYLVKDVSGDPVTGKFTLTR